MINNLKLEATMIDGPEKLLKLSSSIHVAFRQRENLGMTDQVAVTRSILRKRLHCDFSNETHLGTMANKPNTDSQKEI